MWQPSHDLSGVGRCSLTVIMPILSAMGVQACPVPTAILSTHTGGFGEVAFQDLTDYLPQALSHYQRLNLDFSCVYSGFLGSEAQIDHCLAFFQAYPDALAVVDPVMGDHGRAYRTVTEGMQRRMIELVGIADIITPNLTEACILLGEPYNPMPLTRAQAKSMLARLSEKGAKKDRHYRRFTGRGKTWPISATTSSTIITGVSPVTMYRSPIPVPVIFSPLS